MKWKVELNGHMTIVEARTQAAAIREAVEGYLVIRCTRATKEDAAWFDAMSGPIPPKPKERRPC